MTTHRIVLLAASIATVGLVDPLAAQENTLPPVTADSPNLDGGPWRVDFMPERGTCFYDGEAFIYRARLSNSVIGAEVIEMGAGRTAICSATYAVHLGHIAGPWAYMFADGPAYPDRMNLPSLEEVEAIKRASLKAAGGDPTRPVPPVMPRDDRYRMMDGHAPVPTIGDGHGVADLKGQTIRLYAAPSAALRARRSVPALKAERSWVGSERRFPSFDDAGSRASYGATRMQSLSRSTNSAPRPAASTERAPRSPRVESSPRPPKVEQEQ